MLWLLTPASPVVAQPCTPHWSAQFGGSAGLGLTGGVGPRAFTLFDPDGGGPNPPALVVAGAFGTAGGVNTGNIALWNGSTWSGFNGGVGALAWDVAVFDDDGPGPIEPALYAAGDFRADVGGVANRIARWNETAWQPLGSGLNDTAFALAVFDEDGDGPNLPALFVGGEFTSAGGVAVNRIARWNGSTFSAVGTGLPGLQVKELYVFEDDGDGPNAAVLLAGTDAGGGGVYRLNGQTWSFMGGFIGGGVRALASVDHDGPGPNPPVLYAGGSFVYHEYPNAVNYIARFVGGTSWAAMAQGVLGNVRSLSSFDDDGAGPNPPALYVGGEFLTASGVTVNHVAKWDGQSWSAIGSGITPTYAGIHVDALGVFDPDGAGSQLADLYAGGFFGAAGGNSSYSIAAWLGCATPLPPGDIDGDGDVDIADRDLFVGVLLDASTNQQHIVRADLDGNGAADGLDVRMFIVALLGG